MKQGQLLTGLGAALLTALMPVCAEQQKGDGSLRFEYQYMRAGEFDAGSNGKFNIGHVDGHTLMLSFTYAMSDRLTVNGSLPWIKRRHSGPNPHDPAGEFTAGWLPPNMSLIDDGNYHTDWGDVYIGASYIAKKGPLQVTPFISFGRPTNDYQFFANSAPGKGLWHLPVGVAIDYSPPFSDWYIDGSLAYIFLEEELGVSASYWLANASFGYFLTPRFAPKIFISHKYGIRGLDFPADYLNSNFADELWYRHDQISRHNYTNGGIGFDYVVSPRYQLSGTVFTMLIPDNVTVVDLGWSLAITRFFSKEDPLF